MGEIKQRSPVKLIIGFILSRPKAFFKEDAVFAKAKDTLQRRFGKIDFESRELPFLYTDYYERELGKNLRRKFVSFKKLIPADALARIKIATNRLEQKLSLNNRRLINIDPGYLDLSKLVLATTKDYNHRIYLSAGIYAEITLFFQNKTFNPWQWTYPDYQTKSYIDIFNQIRGIYSRQINR